MVSLLLFTHRSHDATVWRFTPLYALVIVASLLITSWAIHEARAFRGPRARSRAFNIIAWLPWLALGLILLVAFRWWLLRPWQLRLFAAYAAFAWSWHWTPGRDDTAWSRWSPPLLALAGAIAVLALNGLAVSTTLVTGAVSITLGLAAVALLRTAVSPAATDIRRMTAFALTLAIVVALAAGELALQACGSRGDLRTQDDPDIVRAFHHNTPLLGSALTQPHRLDEFAPAVITTNSLGMRGPEPSAPLDCLLIGDSFIYAAQLPWDATVGARLADALGRSGLTARVASHGVVSWSPLLDWNWYLKVGRRLRPRTTLLFFFWNDLWIAGDEASDYRAILDPDGRPDHFAIEPPSLWFALRRSRLIELIEQVQRSWRGANLQRAAAASSLSLFRTVLSDADAREDAIRATSAEPPLSDEEIHRITSDPLGSLPPRLRALASTKFWPSFRSMSLWSGEQHAAAKKTETILQRFAADVAADGGRLGVVYVPNPLQVGEKECRIGRYFDRIDDNTLLPDDSGIQQWLSAVTTRHGIDFLDPTTAMRTRAPDGADAPPLYLRYDCHWSAAGHQFVADYVARWYVQRMKP